jgi:hypothetical protein
MLFGHLWEQMKKEGYGVTWGEMGVCHSIQYLNERGRKNSRSRTTGGESVPSHQKYIVCFGNITSVNKTNLFPSFRNFV